MKINFTAQARDDLIAIRDWIAHDDVSAADRVISRIRQSTMMFEAFPMLGHVGRIAGTREFLVTGLPYLIVYRLASETEVDILTIGTHPAGTALRGGAGPLLTARVGALLSARLGAVGGAGRGLFGC